MSDDTGKKGGLRVDRLAAAMDAARARARGEIAPAPWSPPAAPEPQISRPDPTPPPPPVVVPQDSREAPPAADAPPLPRVMVPQGGWNARPPVETPPVLPVMEPHTGWEAPPSVETQPLPPEMVTQDRWQAPSLVDTSPVPPVMEPHTDWDVSPPVDTPPVMSPQGGWDASPPVPAPPMPPVMTPVDSPVAQPLAEDPPDPTPMVPDDDVPVSGKLGRLILTDPVEMRAPPSIFTAGFPTSVIRPDRRPRPPLPEVPETPDPTPVAAVAETVPQPGAPRREPARPSPRARPVAVLTLSGVSTDIGRYHILDGVDLEVPKGGVTMLLGRNGVGKTTTLRTIMGLWRARAGRINLGGEDISGWSTPRIARAGIGYVPEDMGIFGDLTVAENMTLAAIAGRVRTERLDWIFATFPPLKTFWKSRAGTLSGGQKQMLSIARVLIEKRQLYLIDEPTKGLAPAIVATLASALRSLKAEGASILMVEQNFAVARALGDTCVVMDDGRGIWSGAMAELAGDPDLAASLMGLSLTPKDAT